MIYLRTVENKLDRQEYDNRRTIVDDSTGEQLVTRERKMKTHSIRCTIIIIL